MSRLAVGLSALLDVDSGLGGLRVSLIFRQRVD
jgi:hypothetical protein